MWAYQKAFHPNDPWLLFASMALATLAVSWLAFTLVERPLTRWLNRKLGAGG